MTDLEKKAIKRLVVKIGSSSLAHPNGKPNLKRMENLARVVSDLCNRGIQVVIVTSGAIGAGLSKLGLSERPREMEKKQAAAAVGQCELMFLYDKFFSEYGHTVGQLLLTRDVIDSETLKSNVINTFETLLQFGVIPIVNENDTVSVEEIAGEHTALSSFGENDTLSAIVSMIVHADLLVLLSDIDGLYDRNPKEHKNANIIRIVEDIDEGIKGSAGGIGSPLGTGGMATKISAAEMATGAGIDVVIASGENPEILYDIIEGRQVGTLFRAKGKANGKENPS